jgi:hypothetical protein
MGLGEDEHDTGTPESLLTLLLVIENHGVRRKSNALKLILSYAVS